MCIGKTLTSNYERVCRCWFESSPGAEITCIGSSKGRAQTIILEFSLFPICFYQEKFISVF
nr:MAG TPA: hypothetical protein [Caudoviricetes sp.]